MGKIIKTFENFGKLFKNKYDGLENLSKSNGVGGEVDQQTKNVILDVNNYNKWLIENGRDGIIGRVDKLSPNMVNSYFLDQGVECDDIEIRDFINKIRKQWLNK